jgi:uncharacterized protein (DUF58 family)
VSSPPLVPATVEATAFAATRVSVAFGRSFFVLVVVGLVWLIPALSEPRFMYLLVAWNALVLAAWLLDLARLPAPATLTVQRTWLGAPALSVQSRVRVTLVNGSSSRLRATIVDTLPQQLCLEPPALRFRVGPQSESEAEASITPSVRGQVGVGDAYIRYQSAFGIAERWARAKVAQTIVVYPNLEEAQHASLSVVGGQHAERERQSRRGAAGRSFESLREYQPGDELRDICWTASARRGKLVTRLYEPERSQSIWIVIDGGRLMRARVTSLTKADHAVNAALALAQVALASGDRVGLLGYGRRINHRLPVARGSRHLRQIIEQLASLRAEPSEADHLLAAGRLMADQRRRALIVWITDVPDTSMTPEVVAAASQLMQRHVVLFVAIGQPDLQRLAARRAATVEEMFETAAAHEVIHRREILLAGLRSHGALAIDANAGLTPRLVNAYLDVKRKNLV